VNNSRVVEATQNVYDGIALADVGKELVAQTFTLASSLHKTCNVHNIAYGRNYTARLYYLCQLGQTLVGHTDLTQLCIYGAEGEIGRLCLGAGKTIKQC
jgi:hypothetical protein